MPTQSPTLEAWPKLDPVMGTDLTAAMKVSSTAVPGTPAGILAAKKGGWVFAAMGPATSGKIGVLQRAGGKLTSDHAIDVSTSATPFGLAQSADGSLVVAAVGSEVVLLDAAKAEASATDAVIARIPNRSTKGVAIDVKLSTDDKFAFAALEHDGAVAVIDVQAKAYVGAIPIAGSGLTAIAVSPAGDRIYVSAQATNEFLKANPQPERDQIVGSITVIDAAVARTKPAESVLGRAFVGRAPVRLALTDDGATLWVTLRGSNALVALSTEHLLSTTCNPLRTSVAVGPAPVGLALLRGGAGVAVANSNRFAGATENQTVTFVGTARALVVGQATVGAFPREIAVDGDEVFVSNFNSRSVSRLELGGVPFD